LIAIVIFVVLAKNTKGLSADFLIVENPKALQIYNKYEQQLSPEEIKELENEIDGKIFEIECYGDVDILEFEHLICEEITSETGWLVNTFSYRHVVIGEK
jgi:hypothetical protein